MLGFEEVSQPENGPVCQTTGLSPVKRGKLPPTIPPTADAVRASDGNGGSEPGIRERIAGGAQTGIAPAPESLAEILRDWFENDPTDDPAAGSVESRLNAVQPNSPSPIADDALFDQRLIEAIGDWLDWQEAVALLGLFPGDIVTPEPNESIPGENRIIGGIQEAIRRAARRVGFQSNPHAALSHTQDMLLWSETAEFLTLATDENGLSLSRVLESLPLRVELVSAELTGEADNATLSVVAGMRIVDSATGSIRPSLADPPFLDAPVAIRITTGGNSTVGVEAALTNSQGQFTTSASIGPGDSRLELDVRAGFPFADIVSQRVSIAGTPSLKLLAATEPDNVLTEGPLQIPAGATVRLRSELLRGLGPLPDAPIYFQLIGEGTLDLPADEAALRTGSQGVVEAFYIPPPFGTGAARISAAYFENGVFHRRDLDITFSDQIPNLAQIDGNLSQVPPSQEELDTRGGIDAALAASSGEASEEIRTGQRPFLEAWFRNSVFPRLNEADGDNPDNPFDTNDADLETAMRDYAQWQEAVALLNFTPADIIGDLDALDANLKAVGGLQKAVLRATACSGGVTNLLPLTRSLYWSAVAETIGLATDENGLSTGEVLNHVAQECIRVTIFESQIVDPAGGPTLSDPNAAGTLLVQAKLEVKQSNGQFGTPSFTVPLQIHVDPQGRNTIDEPDRIVNSSVALLTTPVRLGTNDSELRVSISAGLPGLSMAGAVAELKAAAAVDVQARLLSENLSAPLRDGLIIVPDDGLDTVVLQIATRRGKGVLRDAQIHLSQIGGGTLSTVVTNTGSTGQAFVEFNPPEFDPTFDPNQPAHLNVRRTKIIVSYTEDGRTTSDAIDVQYTPTQNGAAEIGQIGGGIFTADPANSERTAKGAIAAVLADPDPQTRLAAAGQLLTGWFQDAADGVQKLINDAVNDASKLEKALRNFFEFKLTLGSFPGLTINVNLGIINLLQSRIQSNIALANQQCHSATSGSESLLHAREAIRQFRLAQFLGLATATNNLSQAQFLQSLCVGADFGVEPTFTGSAIDTVLSLNAGLMEKNADGSLFDPYMTSDQLQVRVEPIEFDRTSQVDERQGNTGANGEFTTRARLGDGRSDLTLRVQVGLDGLTLAERIVTLQGNFAISLTSTLDDGCDTGLSSNPATIPAGRSLCLVATLRKGRADVSGEQVHFSLAGPGTIERSNVITGSDGRAVNFFRPPVNTASLGARLVASFATGDEIISAALPVLFAGPAGDALGYLPSPEEATAVGNNETAKAAAAEAIARGESVDGNALATEITSNQTTWFTAGVRPALQAGQFSDDALRLGIAQWLHWRTENETDERVATAQLNNNAQMAQLAADGIRASLARLNQAIANSNDADLATQAQALIDQALSLAAVAEFAGLVGLPGDTGQPALDQASILQALAINVQIVPAETKLDGTAENAVLRVKAGVSFANRPLVFRAPIEVNVTVVGERDSAAPGRTNNAGFFVLPVGMNNRQNDLEVVVQASIASALVDSARLKLAGQIALRGMAARPESEFSTEAFERSLTIPPSEPAVVEVLLFKGAGPLVAREVVFTLDPPTRGTIERSDTTGSDGIARVTYTPSASQLGTVTVKASYFENGRYFTDTMQITVDPNASVPSGSGGSLLGGESDAPEASGLLNNSNVTRASNSQSVPLTTGGSETRAGNASGLSHTPVNVSRGGARQDFGDIREFFAKNVELLHVVDFDTIMGWFNGEASGTPDDLLRVKLKLDGLMPVGEENLLEADLSRVLPDNWEGQIALNQPRLTGQIVFGIDTSASPFYVVTSSTEPELPGATELFITLATEAALRLTPDGDGDTCDPLVAGIELCNVVASGSLESTLEIDFSAVAAIPQQQGKLRFHQLDQLSRTRVGFDGDPIDAFDASVSGQVKLPLLEECDTPGSSSAPLDVTGSVRRRGEEITLELHTGTIDEVTPGIPCGELAGFKVRDLGFAAEISTDGTFSGEIFGRAELPFSLQDGGEPTEIAIVGQIDNEHFELTASTSVGRDAISILTVPPASLPSHLALDVTVNAERSGLIVFDYVEVGLERRFQFAGIDAEGDEFVIGHHDADGYHVDVNAAQSGLSGTTRKLRLVLNGTQIQLQVEQVGAGGAATFVTKISRTSTEPVNGSLGLAVRGGATSFDDVRLANLAQAGSEPLLIDGFAAGAGAKWRIESGLWKAKNGQYQGSTDPLEFGEALIVDRGTLTVGLDVTFDENPGNSNPLEPVVAASASLSEVDALLFQVNTGGTPLRPVDPQSPRGLVVANDLEATIDANGFTASAGRFSAGLNDVIFVDLFNAALDLTDDESADLFSAGCVELRVPSLAIDDSLPLATLRSGNPGFVRCNSGGAAQPVIALTKPTDDDPIPELVLKQAGTRFDLQLANLEPLADVAGWLPFEVSKLSVIFNDPNDLTDVDIAASVQVDPDILGGLPAGTIVAVGDPLASGQSCPAGVQEVQLATDQVQRFCNGAIDAQLHLPSLLGIDPGFPFTNLGPIHLGVSDVQLAPGVFADGLITLGRFTNGQFDGQVSGRVVVANSKTITKTSNFIEVQVSGILTESVVTVDTAVQTRFGNRIGAASGTQATLTTLNLTGFAQGRAGVDGGAGIGAGIDFNLVIANAAVPGDPVNLVLEPAVQSISTTFTIPLGDPNDPFITLFGSGTLDFTAGPDEPAVVFDTVGVEFGDDLDALDGLTIEAGGVGLGLNDEIFILPGFHFILSDVDPPGPEGNGGLFGLPSWFPVRLTGLGLKFHGDGVSSSGQIQEPVKLLHPTNFSLLISAELLPNEVFPLSGSFTNLEVDLGLLAVYDPTDPLSQFPIVNISGVTIGIEPFVLPPRPPGAPSLEQQPPTENEFVIGGRIGFGQIEEIIYAQLKGEFGIKGIRGGIELVITEVGPVLGKVTAPVGIPLGPTGLILTDVTGGFVFADDVVPDVADPRDLINSSTFVNVLDLTDAQIRASIQRIIDDPEIDFTWELPLTVGLAGNLTTVASPGIINGEVTLAANIGATNQQGELLKFKLIGAGEATIWGLPLGRAGIVLDLDNPLNPNYNLGFAAPPPGSPLGFLFPAQGEFLVHIEAGGLFEAPLVGMRRVLETLTTSSLLDQAAAGASQEVQGILEAIPAQMVELLRARRNSSGAKLLLDANGNGQVDESELSVPNLVSRSLALLPASFAQIVSSGSTSANQRQAGELLVDLALQAVEHLTASSQNAAEEIADALAIVLRVAADVVRNEAAAALQRISPALEISGLIQPTILGFPFGEPTDEVLIGFHKVSDSVSDSGDFLFEFGLTTSLKQTIKRQVDLLTGGIGGLLIELITLGATDQLTLRVENTIPVGVVTAMLTGRPTGVHDSVSAQLIDAFNPLTGWQVFTSGTLFWTDFKIAEFSGILFGPQDINDDGDIDDLDGLFAERVRNMDLNGDNEIQESEKVSLGEDQIPVFRTSQFESMIDFGGMLLTGTLMLPKVLTDPLAVFAQIDAPPEPTGINFNLPAEALSQITALIDAYTSEQLVKKSNGQPCGPNDPAASCEKKGYIPRTIETLTQEEIVGNLQVYVPSPATLLDVDYLNFDSEDALLRIAEDVQDQALDIFNAFYLEGFLTPKLLGIPLGNATVSATTSGFEVEAVHPLLPALSAKFAIGRNTVNAGELVGNLFANPALKLIAEDLPLPLDKMEDLLRELGESIEIPFPVTSLEVEASTDNLRDWLKEGLGLPNSVVNSLIQPSDSSGANFAGITFAAYSPGFDFDAPHPSAEFFPIPGKERDDVKRYGGFRLDAHLNVGSFIRDARFYLEAELPSNILKIEDFVLPDFVAFAHVDKLSLGGSAFKRVLDADLTALLAKEGACATMLIDGGLSLLQTVDLDVAGNFVLDLGSACPGPTGLYGAAELRLSGGRANEQTTVGDDKFSITGNFELQVNTTDDQQLVTLGSGFREREFTLDGGPYARIHVDGSLEVLGFPIADAVLDIQTSADRFLIGGSANLDLGPLGSLAAEGGLAIQRKNNRTDVAAALTVVADSISASLGPVPFVIDGRFDFAANTGSQSVTIPNVGTIPAGQNGPFARLHVGGNSASDDPDTDRDETKAFLSVFDGGFTAEGTLDLTYQDEELVIRFDAGVDVLDGIIRADVDTTPEIRIGPFGVEGAMEGVLTSSLVPGVELGSITASIDRFGCVRTNVFLLEEIAIEPNACEQHVFIDKLAVEAAEGSGGRARQVRVLVRLTEPVPDDRDLRVFFDVISGSADATDFENLPATPLVIGSGKDDSSVKIDITGDDLAEFTESFTVRIESVSYTGDFPPTVILSSQQDTATVTILDDDCQDTDDTLAFVLTVGNCVRVHTGAVEVSVVTPNSQSQPVPTLIGLPLTFKTSANESGPLQIQARFLNPQDEIRVDYAVVPKTPGLFRADTAGGDIVLNSGSVVLKRDRFDQPDTVTVNLENFIIDSIYEMDESFDVVLTITKSLADRAVLPKFLSRTDIQDALRSVFDRQVKTLDPVTVKVFNDDNECPLESLVCYNFDQSTGSMVAGQEYAFTRLPVNALAVTGSPFIHSGDAARRFSLAFDGRDDVVASTLVESLPAKALTLEFWILPQPQAAVAHPLSLGGENGLTLYIAPGGKTSWRFVSIGGKRIEKSIGILKMDQWQHVAVTYDGKAVQGYIDGELVASQSASGLISYPSDQFVVGALNSLSGKSFAGNLDDLRLWSRALTASEIKANFQKSVTPGDKTLTLYWKMDEGRGTIVGDLSGHAQHGRFFSTRSRQPSWSDTVAPISSEELPSHAALGLARVDPDANPRANSSPAIAAERWEANPAGLAAVPNLIVNPGEVVNGPSLLQPSVLPVPGWQIVRGGWTGRAKDGPVPVDGTNYFQGGTFFGSIRQSTAVLQQKIPVDSLASRIDAGVQEFVFTGYVRSLPPTEGAKADAARIVVSYLGTGGNLLAKFDSKEIVSIDKWQAVQHRQAAPVGTRFVQIELIGRDVGSNTRTLANPNDRGLIEVGALFDGLSLQAVEPAFYEFTLTFNLDLAPPINGVKPTRVTLSHLDFWDLAAPQGLTGFELRSSVDNFASVLAAGQTSDAEYGHHIRLPIPNHEGLTPDPITFRLYGLGDSLAEWRVENVAILGGFSLVDLPPVVSVSANQEPCFGPVTLTAAASDPEGKALTFAWEQTAGPSVGLSSTSSSSTSFAPPSVSVDSVLTFRITVSDGKNSVISSVSVTIHPNRAPTANAGPDQTIFVPNNLSSIGLSGSGSDPDGCDVTFSWVQSGGTGVNGIDHPNSDFAAASFTPAEFPAGEVLAFTLTASDGVRTASDVTLVNFVEAPDIPDGPPTPVFDGPLASTIVFLDANDNGVLDFDDANENGAFDADEPGEPAAATDADGLFRLRFDPAFDRDGDGRFGPADGVLVAAQGIDTSTGLPLSVPLRALPGSGVINPLTTLLAQLVRGHTLSSAAAQSLLIKRLGFPTVDLEKLDAYIQTLEGDANASAVFSAQAIMHDSMVVLARLLVGLTGVPGEAAGKLAYDSLAAALAGGTGLFNVGSAATWTPVIQAALAKAGKLLPASNVTDVANVIAASAQRIVQIAPAANAAYLQAVAKVQTVAQGLTAGDLEAAGSGTLTFGDAVVRNTGTPLTDRIAAAKVGEVTPPLVTIDDVQQLEGTSNSLSMAFTVRLSAAAVVPVTVSFVTQAGSAKEGVDYLPVSGTVLFAPGQTIKMVSVPLVADRDAEAPESLIVSLDQVENARLGDSLAVGLILNDDAFAPVIRDGTTVRAVTGQPVVLMRDVTGQVAGLPQATIDWGDGAIERGRVATIGGKTIVLGIHTYALAANRTLKLTLREAATGKIVMVSSLVQVAATLLIDDPLVAGRKVLAAGGTAAADVLEFQAVTGGIRLVRNGVATTAFAGVQQVAAYGLGGDDRIFVASTFALPAEFYGGDGDDELTGGNAGDVLFGDGGKDILRGNGGADLFFGGEGNDSLDGGAGDDLARGGPGNDAIQGGTGNDVLQGELGDDQLLGGSGLDTLLSRGGSDTMDGGLDRDVLVVSSGTEVLIDAALDDVLVETGTELVPEPGVWRTLADANRLLKWWHNLNKPLDVSDNGVVSAFDALLIVNELNRGGPSELVARFGEPDVIAPPYVDASGDDRISAFDALKVVNLLNARASQIGSSTPEGESAPPPVAAPALAPLAARDAWFAAIDSGRSPIQRVAEVRNRQAAAPQAASVRNAEREALASSTPEIGALAPSAGRSRIEQHLLDDLEPLLEELALDRPFRRR